MAIAKTSGTVIRDSETKNCLAVADRHVPSNDPGINCGTLILFVPIPEYGQSHAPYKMREIKQIFYCAYKTNAFYLNVDVFNTKILIGGTPW